LLSGKKQGKTYKQKDKKNRKTERQISRKTKIYLLLSGKKQRETDRQRDRETERQRDRETERQRDRETERQKDRKTVVSPILALLKERCRNFSLLVLKFRKRKEMRDRTNLFLLNNSNFLQKYKILYRHP
jgi:hypothetical protein